MVMLDNFFLKLLFLALIAFILTYSNSFASPDKNSTSKESESTTIGDVKKEISDVFNTISKFSADQRDQAADAARKDLEQLDQKIDVLEAKVNRKWDQLSDESRNKWHETLAALKKKRVETAEWYGGVKRGSADAWDEIKQGYNKAFSELNKAWQKAKEDFRAEENTEKENKM